MNGVTPARRASRARLLVASAVLLALASCGGPAPTPGPTTPPVEDTPPSRIFGDAPENPFLVDVEHRPRHRFSDYWMKNITGQIAANAGAVPINTGHFNPSFYVADAATPTVRVGYHNCQDKEGTPPGLYDGPRHFVDVPVPAEARPAKGTDGNLSIWSPSRDQFWEFWIMRRAADGGWEACWGGRIDHVSTSQGTFPAPYGASASGLATVGSMITLDDARRGRIDHAMTIGLKAVAQEQTFVPPANRSDGKDTGQSAVPMGTRLRLDPHVDVDGLDLTPLGKAVARAAQQYGFIVSETSGVVAVGAESGEREKRETGKDPWASVLGDVPDYQQLRNFPWDRVEVVAESG